MNLGDKGAALTRGVPIQSFLTGHKIRVEISSSYAPVFNPNPNTGNPLATDTESRPAKQTIFHDRPRASYIALPVMPNT